MFLLWYLEKIWFLQQLRDKKSLKTEILSGLTIALALVPESIAFSFVAWINPIIWLNTAFLIVLITSIFWGRPGMISWFTWALAVVMVTLVRDYWIEYLFSAVILMWIFQILFWLFWLAKFVRLIPHPVMLWFVNWLAILIFIAQLEQFKIWWEWVTWLPLFIMLWLILLTMWIIHFLPKITKSIPSWLVAILVITLMVSFIPWLEWVRTISSYLVENWYSSLSASIPSFHIPWIDIWFIELIKIIAPYSLVLAIIGLTESLMTMTLIDEITDTRWRGNKESIAQWFANTVCWFFGSAWGCAMIGQSMININNWARWRLSWISAWIFLISLIVFASSFISIIPLAALIGLMFMVVIWTFAWPTLKMLNKIPKSDAFVLISVTALTVITWDLAIAVVFWVIISALVFAWQKAENINVVRSIDEKNITHYDLEWPLFFGSITKFKTLFDISNDTSIVIIDFADSKVMDHSAIEAINSLTEKYEKVWKELHLKHLSKDCISLIKNADKIVDINLIEDPKYFVADDKLA